MVIVDWMMPELDGPELIRRIRDAGWPGYTYIILLTAKSGRDDIVEGLNLGADDYVTKPFRHDELLARMGVGARILAAGGAPERVAGPRGGAGDAGRPDRPPQPAGALRRSPASS